MEKFVVGILAVLCLHIGFVLYVGDSDSGDIARLGARNNSEDAPIFNYPPRIVSNSPEPEDTIMIARGGAPEMEFDGTLPTQVSDRPEITRSAETPVGRNIEIVEKRSFDPKARTARAVRRSGNGSETVFQNASYTVTRSLVPGKSLVSPPVPFEDRSGLVASSKRNKRGEKRSLLAKMSPIVKKPYDLLKAVGSWIR